MDSRLRKILAEEGLVKTAGLIDLVSPNEVQAWAETQLSSGKLNPNQMTVTVTLNGAPSSQGEELTQEVTVQMTGQLTWRKHVPNLNWVSKSDDEKWNYFFKLLGAWKGKQRYTVAPMVNTKVIGDQEAKWVREIGNIGKSTVHLMIWVTSGSYLPIRLKAYPTLMTTGKAPSPDELRVLNKLILKAGFSDYSNYDRDDSFFSDLRRRWHQGFGLNHAYKYTKGPVEGAGALPMSGISKIDADLIDAQIQYLANQL